MKIICLILTDGYKLNVVKYYDVCMSLQIGFDFMGLNLTLSVVRDTCKWEMFLPQQNWSSTNFSVEIIASSESH